jgi:hypothetical protein
LGIKQAVIYSTGILCCRFDEELVASPPDNVMVVNWFPQHDLLGKHTDIYCYTLDEGVEGSGMGLFLIGGQIVFVLRFI